MTVYCVFHRLDISVFHYEFILVSIFHELDSANKFVEDRIIPGDYRIESFFVK
jgi:hypothetical protein